MKASLSQLLLSVHSLIPKALASTDPYYNSSFPFRPRNITGLSTFYAWTGSYYNATTTIELTPKSAGNSSSGVDCNGITKQVFTSQFESLLAITERSTQNLGTNPVNVLLTLWEKGSNISIPALNEDSEKCSSPGKCTRSDRSSVHPSSPEWTFMSSPWILSPTDDGGRDNLNLTTIPTRTGQFGLKGTILQDNSNFVDMFQNLTADMVACDIRQETKTFKLSFVGNEDPINIFSNSTAATITINFDAETANYTLSGNFMAIPIRLQNSTRGPGEGGGIYGSEIVRGKVKISFRGIVDPYHSDILAGKNSMPSWIRTVGFGNNSRNIGYGESENQGSQISAHAIICLIFAIASMLVLF